MQLKLYLSTKLHKQMTITQRMTILVNSLFCVFAKLCLHIHHNTIRRVVWGYSADWCVRGGLFQFLGEAEGEFDAGDEAGEFVFTAEGADGIEDAVHFFQGLAVHSTVEGLESGFDAVCVHVVAFVVDLIEEGQNRIAGAEVGVFGHDQVGQGFDVLLHHA